MSRAEQWPGQWPAGAVRIVRKADVALALDGQAARLTDRLRDRERVTLLTLMNGGLYPAVELARRMQRPLLMDYVHATRYRGRTSAGDLHWVRWPERLTGTVLLVDDIFDEGYTLQAVREKLLQEGTEDVLTAVLTVKDHDRGLARDWVDDAALSVPDRYVFGCGMDWRGYWRQLDEIWALPAEPVPPEERR